MTVTDGATAHADELYRIQLRHLDDCPTCRKGVECSQGVRLRRAVRAARLAADKGRPRWT
ncbi:MULTISPECIES: hypothetical protein [Streptomyces]|uniref:Uncharacterized protein n=1 Tax=Streptomyces alboflavus TaxID=67267 RepID=A0A1Z1WCT4_9ACTN|nr:hypothetical protein [Streptomyces alboflavus]ARX84266.1 hypothetical protein SMD44_03704 [Streptomyces alboflavus]